MSKKKLNTSEVLNELSGQSVFFQKRDYPNEQTIPLPSALDHPTDRGGERPPDRSMEPPKKSRRITRRYSFEAYLDQIKQLKKISLQAAIEDDPMPISEMIRDAIDAYLMKLETNASERSDERPVVRSGKRPT